MTSNERAVTTQQIVAAVKAGQVIAVGKASVGQYHTATQGRTGYAVYVGAYCSPCRSVLNAAQGFINAVINEKGSERIAIQRIRARLAEMTEEVAE